MNYQVLARKWRPRTFAQVVGQQHVLQALSNALTHQRLHHAYLLTGTRGVGKTTIARILAKSLNCEQGVTATPCGQCDTCREIDDGRYVDMLEIDAASRTKVEDTRELLDNVQYRPTRGRYKVYLIDEVHMLSRHSFNALLKTLEEPPEHVKFLLATTDPEKLPVTVLSRCLQFHLRALTRDEIKAQLQHILNSESLSYDGDALTLLARAARGSMRDALSLTDQAIALGNQQVSLTSVREMLGHIEGRRVLRLLQLLVSADRQGALQLLRELDEQVADIATVLTELQTLLHQLALVQISIEFADAELFGDEQALTQLAQALPAEVIQVLYRLVVDGRKELPYALDAFSAVEMTLLRILAFRPVNVSELMVSAPEHAQEDSDQLVAEQADNQGEQKTSPTLKAHEASNTTEPEAATTEPAVKTVEKQIQPAPVVAEQNTTESSSAMVKENATTAYQPGQNHSAQYTQHDDSYADSLPPDEDDESDEDDYYADQLAAEQALIEQQAAVQQPHSQPQTDDTARPEKPAAAPEQASLASLMATREQLLAKKKEITPDIRIAADLDPWSASVEGLQVNGLCRQILLNSELERDGDNYRLVVDEQQKALCSAAVTNELNDALRTLLGTSPGNTNLSVEFARPQMTPFLIQQVINSERAEQALQAVRQDARIKGLQQRFAATVDESSVQRLH